MEDLNDNDGNEQQDEHWKFTSSLFGTYRRMCCLMGLDVVKDSSNNKKISRE